MKKIKFFLFMLLGLFSTPVLAELLTTAVVTVAVIAIAAVATVIAFAIASKSTLFEMMLWVYAGSGTFCWFCPLVGGAFEVLNNIATAISTKLQDVFVDLLSIGILFFIVFKVAKLFTQMTEPSVGDFATELLKPLLRVGFVFIVLLLFPYFLFEWIITPVTNISLGMAQEAFQGTGTELTDYINHKMEQVDGGKGGPPFTKQTKDMCKSDQVYLTIPNWMRQEYSTKRALNRSLRNELLSLMCNFSASSIIGLALGVTFFTFAFTDMTFYFWPHPSMLITGLFLTGIFLLLFVFIPFKFIDILLRLFFVLALTPLFLIFWVFPITVQYTVRAWTLLVSSLLNLFFLSVMMGIVENILPNIIPNRDAVLSYLIEDHVTEAAQLLSFTGVDFVITMLVCILSFSLFKMAERFANELGEVPTGFQPLSNIGLSSYMTGMGMSAPVATGKAVSKLGLRTTAGTTKLIAAGGQKLMGLINKARNK